MAPGARASGLRPLLKSRPRKKLKRTHSKAMAVTTETFSVPRVSKFFAGRTQRVTMVYATQISINPGSGTFTGHVFRANSCYDPDVTGTGSQPRGFDELLALYQYGTVIGSRIDVGFSNVNNSQPAVVGLSVRENSNVSSDEKGVLETPTCAWSIIAPNAAGPMICNLTNTCSPKKFFGVPSLLSEDDARFTNASDCTKQLFYHVSAGPQSAVDLGAVLCTVRIEYQVVLSSPIMPTAS